MEVVRIQKHTDVRKEDLISVIIFPQVTKKEAGSYRAVVSDGRGEDVSTLELLDDGEMRPPIHT